MPSLWTRSYFWSTVGTVSSETIQRSIAEQTTRDWIVAKHRKVYRFRMKPTTAQGHALNRMAGARRFIWNLAFRRWKDCSAATAKSIPLAQLSSELTALKKQAGNGLAERYGFASVAPSPQGPAPRLHELLREPGAIPEVQEPQAGPGSVPDPPAGQDQGRRSHRPRDRRRPDLPEPGRYRGDQEHHVQARGRRQVVRLPGRRVRDARHPDPDARPRENGRDRRRADRPRHIQRHHPACPRPRVLPQGTKQAPQGAAYGVSAPGGNASGTASTASRSTAFSLRPGCATCVVRSTTASRSRIGSGIAIA